MLLPPVDAAGLQGVGLLVELDREATRLGVTRQSLIKVWIAEKLDHGDHTAA